MIDDTIRSRIPDARLAIRLHRFELW